jgi:voltage-gated potassium channel Kch
MIQNKKNPNDPDVFDINPEIVKLARTKGFIQGPFNLFLHGDLTWMEALELMVVTVSHEHAKQTRLLIDALKERGPSLSVGSGIARALPPAPLPAPLPRLADSSPAEGQTTGQPELNRP